MRPKMHAHELKQKSKSTLSIDGVSTLINNLVELTTWEE